VTVAGVTTAAAAAAAAPSRPIGEWLRTLDLYKTLFAYITMRMATNFTTLYMALYVTTTLAMDQGAIAAIPFVIFAASLLSVSQLKRLTACLGLRGALSVGAVLFSVGSAGILLAAPGPASAGCTPWRCAWARGSRQSPCPWPLCRASCWAMTPQARGSCLG